MVPQPAPDQPFATVAFLLCHKDFEMGMIAAWSLVQASSKPLLLRFFEDGSLYDTEKERLSQLFPGHIQVSKREADQAIRAKFGEHSAIWKAREGNPLFHKIIDIPLLTPEKRINFSDPDILFFSNPVQFLQVCTEDSPIGYFNKDIADSYVVEKEALEYILGRSMPACINSGLFSIPTQSVDFEAITRFLEHPAISTLWKSHRIEQTLFAIMASRPGYEARLLPASYNVSYEKPVAEVPCKHYVGRIRHGFELEGLAFMLKQG